jgi:hypothetical protein
MSNYGYSPNMDKAQLAPDSSLPLAKRELPSQAHASGLRFKTLDHGGEYPDTMPQAIQVTDRLKRTCLYVPVTRDGKVVDAVAGETDDED